MKLYVDSSVVLRVVLGERGRLAQWRSIERGIASALVEVESLRTLDRMRLRGSLSSARVIAFRQSVFETLDALEIVEISKPVLSRASAPFPSPLGTLDAIHLATALAYRDIRKVDLSFATHDRELADAARAMGFNVLGA